MNKSKGMMIDFVSSGSQIYSKTWRSKVDKNMYSKFAAVHLSSTKNYNSISVLIKKLVLLSNNGVK